MDSSERCPKHDVPLLVRQNGQGGALAPACLLCDVESNGGSEEEIAALKRRFAKAEREALIVIAERNVRRGFGGQPDRRVCALQGQTFPLPQVKVSPYAKGKADQSEPC